AFGPKIASMARISYFSAALISASAACCGVSKVWAPVVAVLAGGAALCATSPIGVARQASTTTTTIHLALSSLLLICLLLPSTFPFQHTTCDGRRHGLHHLCSWTPGCCWRERWRRHTRTLASRLQRHRGSHRHRGRDPGFRCGPRSSG